MTKLNLVILSTLFITGSVLAQTSSQVTETNSLTRAALEKQAANHPPQSGTVVEAPESQSTSNNGSFFNAVLEKQGVNRNIRINKESDVSYSRNKYPKQQTNSLFRGAMAR